MNWNVSDLACDHHLPGAEQVKTYITTGLLSLVGLLNLPTSPEPLPTPAPTLVATASQEDVSAFVQPPEVCDCNCDPERLAKLESLIFDEYANEMKRLAEQQKSDHTALEKRVAALEARPVQVQAVPRPAPVLMPAPAPIVKAQPQSIVQAPVVKQSLTTESYTPRWKNFDGKDRMQHAIEDHGIDISKYTQAQVLAMMDSDHDRYGGNAHSAIRATRTREVVRYPVVQQPIIQPTIVQQPAFQRTYQPVMSNCPGGVCPTQPTYQRTTNTVRRGLFFRR